jgi:hypothetical protein
MLSIRPTFDRTVASFAPCRPGVMSPDVSFVSVRFRPTPRHRQVRHDVAGGIDGFRRVSTAGAVPVLQDGGPRSGTTAARPALTIFRGAVARQAQTEW